MGQEGRAASGRRLWDSGWVFTSRIAADMPSDMELFTTAKQFLSAACRSPCGISPSSRTPAVLKQEQGQLSAAGHLGGAGGGQ